MSNHIPFQVVWALINACNVKCIHCYAASASRSPNELTTSEILHHRAMLARDGLLDVALSGGEPLLSATWSVLLEPRQIWDSPSASEPMDGRLLPRELSRWPKLESHDFRYLSMGSHKPMTSSADGRDSLKDLAKR